MLSECRCALLYLSALANTSRRSAMNSPNLEYRGALRLMASAILGMVEMVPSSLYLMVDRSIGERTYTE